MTQPQQFLFEQVPLLVAQLQPETKPLWGLMSAHHMIEHLGAVTFLSTRPNLIELPLEQERYEARKSRFFASAEPFPRNVRNALLPEVPGETRYPDIDTAKATLLKHLATFQQKIDDSIEFQHAHPLFGMLNGEEWTFFHAKHYKHHFVQFGLLMEETDG